jgi:four helix bundle protein
MFLDLPHSKFDAYKCSRQLVMSCYQLSKQIPDIERYGLIQQIRRAATSVTINMAEGSSRRSAAERRRYYEISRGSIVEIDTILDLFVDLKYCVKEELAALGDLILRCFQMLSGMINNT